MPKLYKLTMAKGCVHMLRSLRAQEINGSAGSAHVRRIMRAQGRLPEARHPKGFSCWNEVMGEWIEDSDNDELALTGSIEVSDWDMPEIMPELGHDSDDVAGLSSLSMSSLSVLSLSASDGKAWGHTFMAIMDEPAQTGTHDGTEATQQDAAEAKDRAYDGIVNLVEGALAAIYGVLLWAAESLVKTVSMVAGGAAWTHHYHCTHSPTDDMRLRTAGHGLDGVEAVARLRAHVCVLPKEAQGAARFRAVPILPVCRRVACRGSKQLPILPTCSAAA